MNPGFNLEMHVYGTFSTQRFKIRKGGSDSGDWSRSILFLSNQKHWTESSNFCSTTLHKENVKINYHPEFSDRRQFLTDFAPQGVEVVITDTTSPSLLCSIYVFAGGGGVEPVCNWGVESASGTHRSTGVPFFSLRKTVRALICW